MSNRHRQRPGFVARYVSILLFMVGFCVYILYTAIHTIVHEKEYWEAVARRYTRENIVIPAKRGSILACDGTILSGTLPEYRLYMDYRVVASSEKVYDSLQYKKESLYALKFDSLVAGLDSIFPDRDQRWFRKRLEQGKQNFEHRIAEKEEPGSCTWLIYDGKATHIQCRACMELPFFNEAPAISGFHAEPIMKRVRPYGDLASRTIGMLFPEGDSAKCGLELSYDSVLRGTPGLSHTMRVRNRTITVADQKPVNGHDLLTTIDINLQDFADKTLREKLSEESVNGDIGIAIVMETRTGDVKAMVNLMKGRDGRYYEMKNHAIADLMEPGSTFKTASMMVAMDDGYITEDYTIDCMGGQHEMYGRIMKDHDWIHGGHRDLTVSQILEQSSNIGVSRIIDRYYHGKPEQFVQGLYREGIALPLDLPFVGKGEPRIPDPMSRIRYWSATDLPWMSIGYVTMLPPISTLTFYNAIANGGTMMKPRFVQAELQDGVVVREYPPVVMKQQICKPSTLTQIQHCLEHVVSRGLGRKAGNNGKLFPVSGKTGTAHFAERGNYASHKYMVSFCGYFPSDAPQYSCIVCIVKTGKPASGGGQCGPVFSKISQYLMGKENFRAIETLTQSGTQTQTLTQTQTETHGGHDTGGKPGQMPDVTGMGARDAVYALQQRGLRVRLSGQGAVVSQSIPAGRQVKPGQEVRITLTYQNTL